MLRSGDSDAGVTSARRPSLTGERAIADQVRIAVQVEADDAPVAKIVAQEHEEAIEIFVGPVLLVAPGSQWQEFATPARPNIRQVLGRTIDVLGDDENIAQVAAAKQILPDLAFL